MAGGHTTADNLHAKAQPQAYFLINVNYLYQERSKGTDGEIALVVPVSLLKGFLSCLVRANFHTISIVLRCAKLYLILYVCIYIRVCVCIIWLCAP